MTDRQKVEKWLDHINERDPACREEVLKNCKADLDARAYYVRRYTEDQAELEMVILSGNAEREMELRKRIAGFQDDHAPADKPENYSVHTVVIE